MKEVTQLNERKEMSLLKLSDLRYPYPKGATAGDDARLRGEPDQSLFNRGESYEVLYLVNKFCDKNKFKKIVSGQKVERLIQKHLPGDIRSQVNVMQWLDNNYSRFE